MISMHGDGRVALTLVHTQLFWLPAGHVYSVWSGGHGPVGQRGVPPAPTGVYAGGYQHLGGCELSTSSEFPRSFLMTRH